MNDTAIRVFFGVLCLNSLAFSAKQKQKINCKQPLIPIVYSAQKNSQLIEAHEKIINWMIEHKKIPTGSRTWTDLGVNYGKFTGTGSYAQGSKSPSARLHNSPQEAFAELLKRFEASDKITTLSEKEKSDLLLELKIRSGDENARAQKIELLRQEAYEKITQKILENKKIPAGFQDWNAMGLNYGKFVGNSDYSYGGESYRARLHNSPEGAFSRLVKHIEESKKLDTLEEKDRAEIMQELKIRAGDDQVFAEKIENQKIEAYEKIIQWTLQNNKIPAGSTWSALGINYGKFVGSGDYALTGESYRSRLHDGPQDAFLSLLLYAEKSSKLEGLSPESKEELLDKFRVRYEEALKRPKNRF